MNGRVSLRTEHFELALAPNTEQVAVMISREPSQSPLVARPMGIVLFTPAGARNLATALRQVVAAPEDEPCMASVPDRCCAVVVEPSPFDEGVLITASAHPPHANGWRGITLHVPMEAQDAARLASLLDDVALLADQVGGVA